MPRIPDSEIERIKTDTNLVALIQSRGVSLKQKGTNWTGLCPFHDDKQTPNLIVTPGKGLFRCMAACCGKTGNAIQFVQWHDGVSFRHAFELLANGGKAAFEQSGGVAKKSTAPKLPCPLDAAEDSKALAQVADYYAERFAKNPDAMAYLTSRGLDDQTLIQRFKIGFADRTLGLRIPHARRKDGAELREKLKALGVYRENGREHLNGCLTVPVSNEKGETVQIYGRRIDPKAPKESRHLYLARPLAGIFNPAALTAREIILTESIIDALTFVRNGMESVTCTFGTANFTEELFEAIRAAKIESVKLAFDADEAGETAAAKAAERLQAIGIECHQVRFPWGMDANGYAVEQGGEALKQAVRNAAWLEPKAINGCNVTLPPAPSSLVANLAAKEPEAPVSAAKEGKVLAQPSAPELTKAGLPAVALAKVGDFHEAAFGPRLYRIGGLDKNNGLEVLKITLRVSCEGLMHVDMTGQSLYYLGESNLKHKILAIVEEEGAEKASYALKLLQSEGELTIASTGKDPHSGRMETQEYHVEGPVMIILTTTAIDIDEELMNRCLILTVDESTAQTERIHALQREARTIEGILANEQRKDIRHLMQDAQRLIAPMRIANPFARHLTFTTGRTRTRRDHEKYLTLIDTIALLHQHQREPIKHQIGGREIEMLPVTIEDIEAANKIAPEVLGRSLDELPPQTRRLLESIKQLIRAKMKAEKIEQRLSLFSRRELREKTGWSHTQIRRHLERLIELEYISTRGGRNGVRIKYELLTDAKEDRTGYVVGLIDVKSLRRKSA